MPKSNQITLDYTNNPDLAEIFSRKKAGDSITLEVTFQIDQIDAKGASGSIEQIECEEYEEEAGEDKTVEPGPKEPIMVMMAPGPSNKEGESESSGMMENS